MEARATAYARHRRRALHLSFNFFWGTVMGDDRRRVLHLAESPYFGGITSHILAVLQAFRNHSEFHVTAATLSGRRGDNALVELAAQQGTPVDTIHVGGVLDRNAPARLRRYVVERGIDLLHTHNYRSTILAAAARLPVPLVNTFHGAIVAAPVKLRFWQWIERAAMRRHAAIIVVSEYVRTRLLEKGLPAEKVRTIYNGCPAPAMDTFDRAALGLDADALVIVFAGRLAEGKGVEHLISATARVDGVQLAILGEGPMRAQLQARAREAGVNALFAGFVADPTPWYLAGDAVALPSALEALPMTLIEAAACGRPAIATRVGGIPEVVAEASGILVEYGDADGLAQAIERMRNDTLRGQMGAAARRVWEERFGLSRFQENLASLYRDVLTDQ